MDFGNEPLVLEYVGGDSSHEIRTIQRGSELLVSLDDLIRFLTTENTELSVRRGDQSLVGLVKAQIDGMDSDEIVRVPVDAIHPRKSPDEVFVTEPGLFRVISQDKSPACRKFQRWLYHEVLSSIRRHGTYPPPDNAESSDLQRLADSLVSTAKLISREIEERERLENEVEERFREQERKLEQLRASLPPPEDEAASMSTITNRAKERGMDGYDWNYTHALCHKFAFERDRPYKKSTDPNSGDSHWWSLDVIDEALDICMDKMRIDNSASE